MGKLVRDTIPDLIRAVAELHAVPWTGVEAVASRRRAERGAFRQRIYLA